MYVAFPSGYAWAHSLGCERRVGLKVEPEEWRWSDEDYPVQEQERHERAARRDLDESGCPVHNGYGAGMPGEWANCPGCRAELEARHG